MQGSSSTQLQVNESVVNDGQRISGLEDYAKSISHIEARCAKEGPGLVSCKPYGLY